MSDSHPHPCRIFGVPASDAPVIVLVRRGPTKWVQLVRWETDADTFTDGQWMKARIYERRCSLSPDGQLFVYFAAKITQRTVHDDKYTYAWTAVSRPPYFTALALWPKGDCWGGGGVFSDNVTLQLNHATAHGHPAYRVNPLRVIAGDANAWLNGWGEDNPIYDVIVRQQGWKLTQEMQIYDRREQLQAWIESANSGGKQRRDLIATVPEIREKLSPGGRFVLVRTLYGIDMVATGGHYVGEWEVRMVDMDGPRHPLVAEWADWDRQGRLIYTRQGCVYAAWPDRFPAETTCLIDLTDRSPHPQPAPLWARRWPIPQGTVRPNE